MKKLNNNKLRRSFSKRKILVGLGIFAVLAVVAFIFRGWIRMSVAPKAVAVIYEDSVKQTAESELNKLQDPFALLGYTSSKNKTHGCETSIANKFSTQVQCYYQVQAFGEIAKASLSKEDLNANAKKLQSLLKQNGWQGEYTNNGVTMSLDKLVTSLTAGIDYQPDATYQKNMGNMVCYLQTNTAFGTPNPPAMATQFSCVRLFNLLGTATYY